MGAAQVFWRIYKFGIDVRYTTVTSLSIILDDSQKIYDYTENNLRKIIQKYPNHTQLFSFFYITSRMKLVLTMKLPTLIFNNFLLEERFIEWSIRDNHYSYVRKCL